MDFEEALEKTKEDREKKKILLIQDDPIAQRLLAVWEYTATREATSWGESEIALDSWCENAQLPPSRFNLAKCEFLIKMGFVFPDGRLHFWAERFLGNLVDRLCLFRQELPGIEGDPNESE